MNSFISLILFCLALGVLVTIHELGHFLTAKAFKVYCSDFSIGFGYKILKIGRKDPTEKKSSLFFINRKNPKAETTFSLGIVPLGGYVGMLGEDDNEILKERPDLKGRSIEDIVFYKKLVVMFAGIFMNFVLAWVIFFISASCFEQVGYDYINVLGINDSSVIAQTITTDYDGKEPLKFTDPIKNEEGKSEQYYILIISQLSSTDNKRVTINDPKVPLKIVGNENKYALILDTNSLSLNDTDYSKSFKIVLTEETKNDAGESVYYPKLTEKNAYQFYTLSASDVINPSKICVSKEDVAAESNDINGFLHLKVNSDKEFNRVGFGMHTYKYWNGMNSFGVASKQWWNSTTVIGKTIASLFYSGETWGQVGGPVAIFSQTTTILSNYPFYYYLNSWGMISVNLALFNLLPFPGLDGWQILVTLIEASVNGVKKSKYKKEAKNKIKPQLDSKEIDVGEKEENNGYKDWKIPAKMKNIVSYLGLGLLFALMAVIFIKDIIGLF